MMRIDAHQHFWQYRPERDTWITPDMAVIARDFLPADLAPLLAAEGIDGCVAVQADMSPAETDFLLALAREHAFIKAVVGWVDLQSPALEEHLSRYAAEPKLAGFRHILQAEPEGFMTHPDFIRGVRTLAEYGYGYDILVYHHQLPEALQLMEQLPDMHLVVDHLAKPDIRGREIDTWAERMKAVAGFPHVSVKLSGLITEADWSRWRGPDIRPYTDAVLNLFGPDRVLFGSDWPVCLLAGRYERVVTLAQSCIAGLPEIDQANIMGGNAMRFYRINDTL